MSTPFWMTENFWLVVGFGGQATFTARFLVQWIASERSKASVMPVAFWWLSILGGLITLAYATYRRDPVFMLGQSMGMFVYSRNLMLVSKARKRAERVASRAAGRDPAPHAVEAERPALAR